MSLADLRDLVIIVFGAVGIVALITLTILTYFIYRMYRRAIYVLDAASRMANAIEGIVSLLTGGLAPSVVRGASFAMGLRKGFEALSKSRGKEGGSD